MQRGLRSSYATQLPNKETTTVQRRLIMNIQKTSSNLGRRQPSAAETLHSNRLRAEAGSHEVRRVPLRAVHASTVNAVVVPGRRVVPR